jgi:tripartite-type tricarboxylate transporter receptor subunit TctC
LIAPAATPKSTVQALNKAFTDALRLPDTQQRFARLMAEPVPTSPEQFGALMKQELKRYEAVVKATGARVD